MNLKAYFKFLQIIHTAIIVGVLLFMVVTVYLVNSGHFEASLTDSRDFFLAISALVTTSFLFAGNFIYKKQMESIKQLTDFKEQFTKIKNLLIIQFVIFEGPAFLSIVFYLVTGSLLFLVFTLLAILFLLKAKPNKEKIILELELSEELKKQLEDPEIIVLDKM